jgi:hypothetical protein
VITEASFPTHRRDKKGQISIPAEVPEVLSWVIQHLEKTEHLRPRIYIPSELRVLKHEDAPGVLAFRKQLKEALHGHEPVELEQESLIALLNASGRDFEVLVIRTETPLPYSSVFIELTSGYWDSDSEQALRSRIEKARMQKLVGSKQ